MNKIDWNLWLPKQELPDTGAKKMLVGQVWAMYLDCGNCLVAKITGHETQFHRAVYDFLAGGGYWLKNNPKELKGGELGPNSPFARHSILVQDVGQAEPTDPDLLYQFLYK